MGRGHVVADVDAVVTAWREWQIAGHWHWLAGVCVRVDVPAEELTDYALGALSGADGTASASAVDRLVVLPAAELRSPAGG